MLKKVQLYFGVLGRASADTQQANPIEAEKVNAQEGFDMNTSGQLRNLAFGWVTCVTDRMCLKRV